MADKTIGDLTQAESIGNEDLFVLQQNGDAKKLKGATLLDFVKPKSVTVTLTSSGWVGGVQTVAISGVLADENAQLIQPVPALTSQAAYIESGILCTGQAENSLTFTATTAPTDDLTVYVVITEVTAG